MATDSGVERTQEVKKSERTEPRREEAAPRRVEGSSKAEDRVRGADGTGRRGVDGSRGGRGADGPREGRASRDGRGDEARLSVDDDDDDRGGGGSLVAALNGGSSKGPSWTRPFGQDGAMRLFGARPLPASAARSAPSSSEPRSVARKSVPNQCPAPTGPGGRARGGYAPGTSVPTAAQHASTVQGAADGGRPGAPEEARPGYPTGEPASVERTEDGRTVSRWSDGTTVTEYTDAGGGEHVERAYENDGASVRETTVTRPDGSTRSVAEVEREGVTERTVSETRYSDQTVEELAGPENADRLGDVSDGPRGQTQITHVTREVVDSSTQPPQRTRLQDTTTYTQEVAIDEGVDGMEVDADGSGQTVAVTTGTQRGADGETRRVDEVGVSTVIEGTVDGRSASLTTTNATSYVDGEPRQKIESTDARGMYDDEVLDWMPVGDKDEYTDRLGDGPVNVRHSEITTWDDEGKAKTSKVQEYGDYDRPSEDGTTVTIVESDDQKLWGLRQVSQDGHRIQQQTSVEGTNAYVLSDTTLGDDGTYQSQTTSYDNDGVAVHRHKEERKIVEPSEIGGDARYRGQFLESAGDGPIYETEVIDVDATDFDNIKSSNARSYSTEDGSMTYGTVWRKDNSGEKRTSLLNDRASGRASIKDETAGTEYAIDGGGQITVDGVRVPEAEGAAAGPGGALIAYDHTDGLSQLYNGLSKLKNLPDIPGRLSGPLAGVGVVLDSMNLYGAVRRGDLAASVGASGGIAQGLGAVSELGANLVSSTRLASALGVGGKALGAVGAVFGAAYGGYQISQGEVVGGSLDLAAAGGFGAVLLGTAVGSSVIPVAGWVVAGGAILTKIGYDIIHGNNEKHKTQELQF